MNIIIYNIEFWDAPTHLALLMYAYIEKTWNIDHSKHVESVTRCIIHSQINYWLWISVDNMLYSDEYFIWLNFTK